MAEEKDGGARPAPGELHAVTGAFGYSGRYIAKRLLEKGVRVMTLTHSANRGDPFKGQVMAVPFRFDEPERLAGSLRGVRVLYNTYWVRFNHRGFTFEEAIRNSEILFRAAKEAGVERIVHVSITNANEESPLEYFRAKGRVERMLIESGLSHAILRPAVLYGGEDILVNNIAWALRKLPFFGVFGAGDYKLRPIHVEDLARLAVEQGALQENTLVDAVGPDTFAYLDLVEAIARTIGKEASIMHVSPRFGYAFTRFLGWFVRDMIITRDEIQGLMDNLLYVDSPAVGKTRLKRWARTHAKELGLRYASEMRRRRDRTAEYVPETKTKTKTKAKAKAKK